MNARIDCGACRERLESYIGGDLENGEAREVADHLAECATCAAAYESTRQVVSGLKDLGAAFAPKERFEPVPAGARGGREARGGARPAWGWRMATAAALVLALTALGVAGVPAIAEQLPLPTGRELGELRSQRAELEARTEQLASEVEQLKIELKNIEGEQVPEVDSATEELPPEVNDAVQALVVRFIRAQYARDEKALREMGTDTLDAALADRPDDYLKKGGGVTFGQITSVGVAEDGTYLVFVRLSDAEFSDSQYQENFGVRKVGGTYLVDSVEMDA